MDEKMSIEQQVEKIEVVIGSNLGLIKRSLDIINELIEKRDKLIEQEKIRHSLTPYPVWKEFYKY